MAQAAGDAEPGLVHDATRDESSMADAARAADYVSSISGSSPAAAGPASSQPFDAQAPVEQSPFEQAPFESSYDSNAWSGQAPQIDSLYQAASAPEASGSQDSYAPGRVSGVGGFPSDQQDVGSYANYASGQQQEQAGTAAQPQQDDAVEDAWQSPPQWNDVIGGGAPGTEPRRDV